MEKRILHLHVKKEYWEQVRDKLKNKEYRIIKPYWTNKLYHRTLKSYTKTYRYSKRDYDLIYYYLGYTNHKLIFEYNGFARTTIKHKEFGDKPVNVFAIDLTKLSEVSGNSSHN